MDYFGDESGNFPSVIEGEQSVFSVAVVSGDPVDTSRCSRRAVRDIRPLSEAKWRHLQDLHKRRYVDCLNDHSNDLRGAYAILTDSKIDSVSQSYRLYQAEEELGLRGDEFVIGALYSALLLHLEAAFTNEATFTFDKYVGSSPSENICSVLEEKVDLDIRFKQSTKSKSIQTADCVAGAVAEDHKKDTEWTEEFPDSISDQSNYGYWMIEELLKDW